MDSMLSKSEKFGKWKGTPKAQSLSGHLVWTMRSEHPELLI